MTDPAAGERPGARPPIATIRYADELHPFHAETRRRFGRDDTGPDVITVWEELRGTSLSKVAGELWCSEGQVWVRNLSAAHELVVEGAGAASVVLPAVAGSGPGAACSVPWPRGRISAPSTGTWFLQVEAGASRLPRTTATPPDPAPTVRVGDVPLHLLPVAEEWCRPLLQGGSLPATYAEIATHLGTTPRSARRRVEELTEHYAGQVRALPGGVREGEPLGPAVARMLVHRNKLGGRDDSGGLR